MADDQPPLQTKPQEPQLPSPVLDLPPGLYREHIDLVQRAASECREALQNPQTNYPIEKELPADLLISICKAYESSYGAWEADHLEQILFARTALKEASDAIRAEHLKNSGDPDAMPSAYESARTIIAELNNLYAEVDTAVRNIDPGEVEKAQSLINARRDVAAPRSDAETEITEIVAQADAIEGEALEAEKANQTVIRNQYSLISIENLHILNGLSITVEKLRASVISVRIAVQNNTIFKGTLELFNDSLNAAVKAAKAIQDKISEVADSVSDVSEHLSTILKPLAKVTKGGEKLVNTVKKTWTKLFGARQELPWPTGLRLYPPEGSADVSTDVELVEIRRFNTSNEITYGLAPLPGGRFVSGGDHRKLRLWSLDQSVPLAELEGHEDEIKKIATLDEHHVVTASQDQTMILWDLDRRETVRKFEGHSARVLDVAALGTDRFVSAGASDVRIWRRDNQQALSSVLFEDVTAAATLGPDQVVTGEYRSNDLRVMNLDAGSIIWRSDTHYSDIWKAAAIDDSRFLTVRNSSPDLRLWSLDSLEPIAAMTDASDMCQDVAALSTTRAISAHVDGICLWSLPDGALLAKPETKSGLQCIRALPREPGGPSRFVCGGERGYLALWEVRPKEPR